jgi:hypothetical protein
MAMAIERNNSFHLLLSDDELKLLRMLAESAGVTASDYLRMFIRGQMDSVRSPLHSAGTRAQLLATLKAGGHLGEDFDFHRALMLGRDAIASTGAKKKR